MQFFVFPMRKEGRLLPRHVMWAGKTRGDLVVAEARDLELNRAVRTARIVAVGAKDLLPPLMDAVLVAAKPDWWTMTGWERQPEEIGSLARAYAQSWVLIPVDAEE